MKYINIYTLEYHLCIKEARRNYDPPPPPTHHDEYPLSNRLQSDLLQSELDLDILSEYNNEDFSLASNQFDLDNA